MFTPMPWLLIIIAIVGLICGFGANFVVDFWIVPFVAMLATAFIVPMLVGWILLFVVLSMIH